MPDSPTPLLELGLCLDKSAQWKVQHFERKPATEEERARSKSWFPIRTRTSGSAL